eukprot:5122431-Prorocentrum_lima.AAC.1
MTLEIAIVRDWLLLSGVVLRWTADENMIGDGLTKERQASRQHLARIVGNNVWSVEEQEDL